MITAAEANKKTTETINKLITNELIEIKNLIHEAIDNGLYSISQEGYLSITVQNKLKSLGYEVKSGCQRNENYYTISWKNS